MWPQWGMWWCVGLLLLWSDPAVRIWGSECDIWFEGHFRVDRQVGLSWDLLYLQCERRGPGMINRDYYLKQHKTAEYLECYLMMMMMMMMIMNCFCGMVDRRKVINLISSLGHCQRFSSSRISDTPGRGFEPAQNLSSGIVEWSCAVVLTTIPRRH